MPIIPRTESEQPRRARACVSGDDTRSCIRVSPYRDHFCPRIGIVTRTRPQARRCIAEICEGNLAAYAAEILVRCNLVIWDIAIYCTMVVRDILIVSAR